VSAREPVTTLGDLDTMDWEEVCEGYCDGRKNELEPGDNRSRSYWHGWRNGMVDGGHRPKDAAQAELARLVYARGLLDKDGRAR
jgi:hypothetical protein